MLTRRKMLAATAATLAAATSRAIGGASRTVPEIKLPKASPSEVMSSRDRAKPGFLAGRRRNMPSKSTIPASLSLSR